METTVWHYGYGKPKEPVELQVQPAPQFRDPRTMTDDEIQAELVQHARAILEAHEAAMARKALPVLALRSAHVD